MATAKTKMDCVIGEEVYSNYILIDIGAYLTHKKFEGDLDSVIDRAKDAGTKKIISVAMSVRGSKENLRLSNLYPDVVYCTVGIHPHEARMWGPESYDTLFNFASQKECVAVGECGLDYLRMYSPVPIQLTAFEEQVKIACHVQKPLYLHDRDAFDDMMKVLKQYKDQLHGGVIHCFTGTVEQAKAYLSLGFYIGITGYVCKDRTTDGVRALLESGTLRMDRILVESDAPYMYINRQNPSFPQKVKDQLKNKSLDNLDRHCTFNRNEPCSLPALVEVIAGLMGETPEDIALNSAFNSLKLFKMN